jgi:hypothetical protein
VATNISQSLPTNLEASLVAFRECVRLRRHDLGLDDQSIWNMDQTMVRFDTPSTRTNNRIGEAQIRVKTTGAHKKGFTVSLCASATGEKLPAYIIFKEASGRIPPRVRARLRVPDNVVAMGNVNGWMTAEQLETWISCVWANNTKGQRLLLLDQYRPHQTSNTRSKLAHYSTEMIGIPAGTDF